MSLERRWKKILLRRRDKQFRRRQKIQEEMLGRLKKSFCYASIPADIPPQESPPTNDCPLEVSPIFLLYFLGIAAILLSRTRRTDHEKRHEY